MDNIIEQFEELVQDFTAKADKFIAKVKQAEKPPVTGRPFCAGVNEPEEGQEVWYWDTNEFKVVCGSFTSKVCPAVIRIFADLLRRGELYPTEQDCIEGNKRDEIRKRYEAMGKKFELGEGNWFAYYDYRNQKIVCSDVSTVQHSEITYFATCGICRAAIDTIDAEYGDKAFERYVLGVNING